MPIDDAVAETWIYAGKRETKEHKLYDVWWSPQRDQLLWYKKRPGLLAGHYEHKVEDDGQHLTVYGSPKWLNKIEMTHPLHHEWVVADNAARNSHARHLREKRAAKGQDSLDVAMERLLPYARACRTKDQKDALIATVLRRLSETW